MTQKRWKLSVTELGSSKVVAETIVEAGDWMTGLGRARGQIGEKGAVPQGASVSVSPDGKVTVLDPVGRRQYVLLVTTESIPAPKPTSVPPPPKPASVPAPSAPAKKADFKKTMAYVPAAEAAPAAAPAAPKVDLKKTMAYTPGQAGLPKAPVPVGAPAQPVAVAPQPVAPPAPAAPTAPAVVEPAAPAAPPAAAPAPAAPAAAAPATGKGKKGSRATIAYMTSPLAPPEAAPAPAAAAVAAPAPPAPEVAAAPAPPAPEVAAAPAPPAPAPAAAPAVVAPAAPASAAAAAPVGPSDDLQLLFERDSEPSAATPLVYRERNWLAPGGIDLAAAEALLRARFAAIKEELASRPRGKLVKLALFDHRWTGQPERPPILVLTWKDWRGEPEILAPARMSAAPVGPGAPAPSMPPVSSSPPAPSVPPGAVSGEREVPPPRRSVPPVHEAASIVVDPSLLAVDAASTLKDVPAVAPARAPVSTPPEPTPSRVFKKTPQPTKGDDRLATAFEALQDLFFLPTPADGADFVLRLLGELVPSEASAIALYDINTDELRFVSAHGVGADERKGDAVPAQVGILGAAIRDTDACTILADVTGNPRFDPGVDGRVGLEVTNAAVMGVWAHGRLLGAFQLLNRIGDLEFGQADANLVAYVGGRFGEFLHQHKVAEVKRPAAQRSAPGRR